MTMNGAVVHLVNHPDATFDKLSDCFKRSATCAPSWARNGSASLKEFACAHFDALKPETIHIALRESEDMILAILLDR